MLRVLRGLKIQAGFAYVLPRETLANRGLRPDVASVDTLCLAPTNRSPATGTLRSTYGPGFSPRAGESGFEALAEGAPEPTADALAAIVDGVYAACEDELVAMDEPGVVFQGQGDPLEAASVVLDTVALVAERRHGVAFRLNTFGLCSSTAVDLLLHSQLVAREDRDQQRETRLAKISVFLPAADPAKYTELIQPHAGRGFQDACAFIARMAGAGIDVECTAVARPDVDIRKIESLARTLGAASFRLRAYYP